MKLIITLALSITTIFSVADAKLHEYYVSVTKVEYVKKEQSVQIISQIFIDDLENVLRQRYDTSLTLALQNEDPKINDYIKRYLNTKIKITINGEAVPIEFIGKEYENDIAYCYLEITNIDQISSFSIENKVLLDIYKDQENIVRTYINQKHKSFILRNGSEKGVLNFNKK
ncbi:MAG: peptidase E [Winogradskyella sp.]|nr:peptidase E [Winogradskyella sp.]